MSIRNYRLNFVVDYTRLDKVVDCFNNNLYQIPAHVSVLIVHEKRCTLGFVVRPVVHFYAPHSDEGYALLMDVNSILGDVGKVEECTFFKSKRAHHYMLRITRFDAVEHTLNVLRPLVSVRLNQIDLTLQIIGIVNQHRAGNNIVRAKYHNMTPEKFLYLCDLVDSITQENNLSVEGYKKRNANLSQTRKWNRRTVQDYMEQHGILKSNAAKH
jgi:hypothetical protein